MHADGIKKFVPVFSALYNSMSDEQKKNSDVMFRGGRAQKNKATMTASTAGKILVGLAFASMIGGLSVGTALGQDGNWPRAQDNRGWQERDRRDRDGWRDHGGCVTTEAGIRTGRSTRHRRSSTPRLRRKVSSIFFPLFR